MAIDDAKRHKLYIRLEKVLGTEEASALMDHLPPVGWADVATKRDVDQLEERMQIRFHALEPRLQALEHKLVAAFRAELRQALFAMAGLMVTLMVTLTGLVFAAARIA